MTTPTTPHAIQPASDDEVWTQGEVDRLRALVERWAHVLLFLICALVFGVCATRWWWCGLIAIGCLGLAGWRSRRDW